MAKKVLLPGQGATAHSLGIDEVAALLDSCDADSFAVLREALKSDTRKGIARLIARTERRLEVASREAARLEGLYTFEAQMAAERGVHVWAGLDEVGRGPIAGPLAAGAVVLDSSTRILGLNDSKQLSPEAREDIASRVKEQARAWHVAFVDNEFIDAHGMVASLKRAFSEALAAVQEALAASGVAVELALLDGNPLGFDAREANVVKGDARCASIAAASIIAKVERDRLMCEYAELYPEYGWESNKGYGTEAHLEAIRQYGLTPLHRSSFCTSFSQLSLF